MDFELAYSKWPSAHAHRLTKKNNKIMKWKNKRYKAVG